VICLQAYQRFGLSTSMLVLVPFWGGLHMAVAQADAGAYTGRVFVDASMGDDNNSGLAAKAAVASIRRGIDLAQAGATVVVAPGTYREAVTMKEGVDLQGSGPETTIMDGRRSPAVVRGASHCRIEGFTITGYCDYDIHGVYCEDVNDFVISHNVIKENTSSGIFTLRSSIVACNNLVTNNRCAGIFVTYGSPNASLILNNTLRGNQNEADIALWLGARAVVANNILDDIDLNENTEDAAMLQYNDILAQPVQGSDISVDPLFADPDKGDYHLKSQAGRWDPAARTWVKDDVTSPCIDAGDPNDPVGSEPFPNGGRVNMGAYGGTAEASRSWFGKPTCETVVAGDINGDCRVDFIDMQILASHWLQDAHSRNR